MTRLYEELYGNNQQSQPQQAPNQFKQMMNAVRMASNPNQAIADMINNSPMSAQIINMLKNSGKTPKELFFELAKQKGVDPNEILKQLQ
jgi:hypothetical protein